MKTNKLACQFDISNYYYSLNSIIITRIAKETKKKHKSAASSRAATLTFKKIITILYKKKNSFNIINSQNKLLFMII